MKRILTACCARPLLIYLVTVLVAISTIAGTAEAMFVPAAPPTRAADLAKIQTALESRTLQQRLMDYGLSSESARAKINGLSNEQVHRLAASIDALQAGGMRDNDLIIVLLLVLLIVILI